MRSQKLSTYNVRVYCTKEKKQVDLQVQAEDKSAAEKQARLYVATTLGYPWMMGRTATRTVRA